MKWLCLISWCFCLAFCKRTMQNLSYVTYVPGNSNIIIASPHGGSDGLLNVAPRQNGCFDGKLCDFHENCTSPRLNNKCRVNLFQDYYTRPIAEMLGAKIEELSGKRPHMIHMNIHRRYLDVNRPKDQGTNGDNIAGQAWQEFHDVVNFVRDKLDIGIYFDVHGQRHSHGLVELGYRVRPANLNLHNFSIANTSIRSLASRVSVDTTLADLIWGNASFGARLEEQGVQCVPSPSIPVPGTRRYYRGGYNTEMYGSVNGGRVDAIQLELPKWARTPENGTVIANALAQSIVHFTNSYY